MTGRTHAAHARGLRMTTGSLMVWVGAVGLALGFLMGDVADWLPRDALTALAALAVAATTVGLPLLSHRMAREPGVHAAPSALALRTEHLFVTGLVGLITASVGLLGLLLYLIVQKS